MLGSASAFLVSAAPRATKLTVHRDPNCGCCLAWAEIMRRSGRFAVTVVEETDIGAVKSRLGVPQDLASCHTTEIAGYVVEGHVPEGDLVRLLRTRPKGVAGLAAPGMPVGSPGMASPDGSREPYAVYAFDRRGGRTVYARHGEVAA